MFFSANENLALRAHKRRIVEYVEETIPESALDAGTNVMVMQVSCRDPGCVPLETAIAIVFPRPMSSLKKKKSKSTKKPKELIEGLEESATGGTFKTKILLPMADVTKEDVLEALPPQFKGGTRTMEKLCLRARDVMLSQITQIMGNDENDADGRQLMAVYLKECLDDYILRGCVPAPFGEPFPPIEEDKEKKEEVEESKEDMSATATTNEVLSVSKEKETTNDDLQNKKSASDEEKTTSSSKAITSTAETVTRGMAGTGNFVFRRVRDDENDDKDKINNSSSTSSTTTTPTTSINGSKRTTKTTMTTSETAMDWRRRQDAQNSITTKRISTIQKLAEREHAPGIRRPGCPCCDIDNPSNIVDEMLML
mmetsp:Transcript_22602/g.32822  ORF Transcript_22602/g.32822 Transcript_22602/m.32822 type:complete len:368 (-) Transcript_22602:368-1471(-)